MVRTSAPMREDSNAESLANTPGLTKKGSLGLPFFVCVSMERQEDRQECLSY